MRKTIFLLFAVWLTTSLNCFAEEKAGMEERIVGSTFKALAKVFVAASDMEKLKKSNIEKIDKMNAEKFKKRYTLAYAILKDLPLKLKVSYGIAESMTKAQAVKNIESLDKKKAYEIIDSIPDTLIAQHFNAYLIRKGEDIKKSNLVTQITNFWSKIKGHH